MSLQTLPLAVRTWGTTSAEHHEKEIDYDDCMCVPTISFDVDYLFALTFVPRGGTWRRRKWMTLQTWPNATWNWRIASVGLRKWKTDSEDYEGDLTTAYDVCHLATVAIMEAVIAFICAAAASARMRTTRGTKVRRGDRQASHRSGRRPARRIGGARRGQRRAAVEPSKRIRAQCRRAEALVVAYLLVSNHVLPVTSPARIGVKRGQFAQGEKAAARSANGQGRPNNDGTIWREVRGDQVERRFTPVRQGDRRWWTEEARIGEAGHPGPSRPTIAAVGLLRRTTDRVRSAISYPRPGKGCLRVRSHPATRETWRSGMARVTGLRRSSH